MVLLRLALWRIKHKDGWSDGPIGPPWGEDHVLVTEGPHSLPGWSAYDVRRWLVGDPSMEDAWRWCRSGDYFRREGFRTIRVPDYHYRDYVRSDSLEESLKEDAASRRMSDQLIARVGVGLQIESRASSRLGQRRDVIPTATNSTPFQVSLADTRTTPALIIMLVFLVAFRISHSASRILSRGERGYLDIYIRVRERAQPRHHRHHRHHLHCLQPSS